MYNITIKSITSGLLDGYLLSVNVRVKDRKEAERKAELYALEYPQSRYSIKKLF